MAPAVYPQKIFHIFSIDDLCSPLRSTTPYETLILQNIVDKVALFFTVPRVLRLVAISLKQDVPCHVTPKAPESVDVTEDDLAFAKKALEGLPQLELVQGLSSEARVIRSADPTDDTPTAVKPVRIQVRAERLYAAWILAMISNGSSPEYKQAFAWVVWVVAHEMMHIVRERVRTSICGNGERVKAYESVSEKTTPPRLRSSNRPQDKLWQPPSEPPSGHTLVTSSSHSLPTSAAKPTIQESHPASVPTTPLKANDIPFEPKGESGHWLEDKLTGGCSLEPIVSDFFTRHEAIHVPDGLPLTIVSSIVAKRLSPKNSHSQFWVVNSTGPDQQDLLTPLFTASSVEQVESVLDGLINHILTTPPTVIKAGADESKKGKAAVVPRDVFDADDAPHYPEVRRYLESLAIAEPEDDGELGACSFNSAASVSRASAHPEIR